MPVPLPDQVALLSTFAAGVTVAGAYALHHHRSAPHRVMKRKAINELSQLEKSTRHDYPASVYAQNVRRLAILGEHLPEKEQEHYSNVRAQQQQALTKATLRGGTSDIPPTSYEPPVDVRTTPNDSERALWRAQALEHWKEYRALESCMDQDQGRHV